MAEEAGQPVPALQAAGPTQVTLGVLGVPSCLGAIGPGPDQGPAAIRAAGLLDRLRALGSDVRDLGDVPMPGPSGRGLAVLRGTDLLALAVRERVQAALAQRLLPILLGGEHTVALGAIAAAAAARPNLGVLWLDAHPDFNTPETSVTGNPHGMVLALAAGLGPSASLQLLGPTPLTPPSRIAILGTRSIDAGERALLIERQVWWKSCGEMFRVGLEGALAEALSHLRAHGAEALYVSVDLDVLDPDGWPGVSTPAQGGLGLEELARLVAGAVSVMPLAALDVVELNPQNDLGGRTAHAAVRVIEAAVQARRSGPTTEPGGTVAVGPRPGGGRLAEDGPRRPASGFGPGGG